MNADDVIKNIQEAVDRLIVGNYSTQSTTSSLTTEPLCSDHIRACVQSVRQARDGTPKNILIHMLDLLALSRVLRADGVKLVRLNKGHWAATSTGVPSDKDHELFVSRFVIQDKPVMLDRPDKPHLRLTLELDYEPYSVQDIVFGHRWKDFNFPDDYPNRFNE